MTSRDSKFEKDPYLRRGDAPSQGSASTSGSRWTEAMKGIPSYSEHMKQIESGKTAGKNAFTQASGCNQSLRNRANAISVANSNKQGVHQTVSDKRASAALSNQSSNKGATRTNNRSK